MTKGRQLIREYDEKMAASGDFSLTEQANEALAKMAREETDKTLTKVLHEASVTMKNGYNRADN
jgi:dipeptidase